MTKNLLEDIKELLIYQKEKEDYQREVIAEVLSESEEIDELNKSTLGSYIKKAASDVSARSKKVGRSHKSDDKIEKRLEGIDKATDKVGEIHKSKSETDKYGTTRWRNSKGELHREGGPAIEYKNGKKEYYEQGKKIVKEEIDEDVINFELELLESLLEKYGLTVIDEEQLDEISKKTLGSYIKKAAENYGDAQRETGSKIQHPGLSSWKKKIMAKIIKRI